MPTAYDPRVATKYYGSECAVTTNAKVESLDRGGDSFVVNYEQRHTSHETGNKSMTPMLSLQ